MLRLLLIWLLGLEGVAGVLGHGQDCRTAKLHLLTGSSSVAAAVVGRVRGCCCSWEPGYCASPRLLS